MTQLVRRLTVCGLVALSAVPVLCPFRGRNRRGTDAATAARRENGTQFLVFFRSQPVGREEVLVLRMADGWIVRGTSRLGPPIDITTRVAEIDYDLQWRPKSLLVDGIVRGQDVTLKTTFDGTKASNVIAVQGAPQSKVDPVSADPVVLPEHVPRIVRGAGAAPAGQDRRLGAARVYRAAGGGHGPRGISRTRAHRDAEGRSSTRPAMR